MHLVTETKYNKVKGWIKSRILDGTYTPNQKISSESELMKKFDVSRHTVRIAIGELVNEGWLYREQGAGTFCTNRTVQEKDTNEERKIAIITTYISDYIFPSIIRGAEDEIRKKGYQVSLFSTNNDHDNERIILETILTQRYDGVIVEPTQSAFSNPNINYYLNLESLRIPYVMINAFYDELEPISVTVDDEKGGYLQTEHLIKQGHKNITGIFKTDDMQGTKRLKGFIKALRRYNIPVVPQNIITYNTSEKNTKPLEALESILESKEDKPTGLVCYNDELAIKILDVIRTKKVKIPEELSMIGFDNSFLAEVSEVKLTTIEHPQSELGRKAARMILEMISTKNSRNGAPVESFVFEPKIIIRSSTQSVLNQVNN